MTRPRIETTESWSVSIFIAGDLDRAKQSCRAFCNEVGLCVTVTPTTYVYRGGEEDGVIVGLINYPRFPSLDTIIENKALLLAQRLRQDLDQESFSIQAPGTTSWLSWRPDDLALAAAARQGGDGAAPGEAPQSGPAQQGNAQKGSA